MRTVAPGRFQTTLLAAAVSVSILASCSNTGTHASHAMQPGHTAGADPRPLVKIPDELRLHMLANMRDHLAAVQEIQAALSADQFDRAADVAEQRLGLSSLQLHGAHDIAKTLPAHLQAVGSEMHRSASRFAVAAKDAGATGDVRPALGALSALTGQCVACHAAFRIQ